LKARKDEAATVMPKGPPDAAFGGRARACELKAWQSLAISIARKRVALSCYLSRRQPKQITRRASDTEFA
jgi:hypothetical protein